MKTRIQTKTLNLLSLAVLLFAAITITSCSKDDDNETRGEAKVRVVNAVEGSGKQNLYLDDKKLNSSAVAYGESTGYISAVTGTRKAEFRADGSSAVSAAFDLPLAANKNYIVFFRGTTAASSHMIIEDNLTPSPSGKARITVVHLATAFEEAIDIRLEGTGTGVISNLGYGTSATTTVDAGSKFEIFPTGLDISLLKLPTEVEAGKNYTVYVTGSSVATVTYRILIRS